MIIINKQSQSGVLVSVVKTIDHTALLPTISIEGSFRFSISFRCGICEWRDYAGMAQ